MLLYTRQCVRNHRWFKHHHHMPLAQGCSKCQADSNTRNSCQNEHSTLLPSRSKFSMKRVNWTTRCACRAADPGAIASSPWRSPTVCKLTSSPGTKSKHRSRWGKMCAWRPRYRACHSSSQERHKQSAPEILKGSRKQRLIWAGSNRLAVEGERKTGGSRKSE